MRGAEVLAPVRRTATYSLRASSATAASRAAASGGADGHIDRVGGDLSSRPDFLGCHRQRSRASACLGGAGLRSPVSERRQSGMAVRSPACDERQHGDRHSTEFPARYRQAVRQIARWDSSSTGEQQPLEHYEGSRAPPASSRARRCRSNSLIGTRARPQRGVGGIACDGSAMATTMVNRFCVSAPVNRPIEATITSVEPRAFIAKARARDSRRVKPPSSPPKKAPANLPRLATAISAQGHRQQQRVLENGEIGAETGGAEEHRHEKRKDQPAQLLADVLG